jgi:predicted metal-binding membrane protein
MMTASWAPMMAAMMLPSALPAIARRAADGDGALAAPLFASSYAGIWALVGLATYALYQPPGDLVAGALIVAGGVYELSSRNLSTAGAAASGRARASASGWPASARAPA